MLFNSIDFAIFLPITFLLYWYVFNKSLVGQNSFLLISSYIFYGWWDYRFLSLIILSSLVDYFVGLGLSKKSDITTRKILLSISIIVNLGLLGFFKYFNFFSESFASAFTLFGMEFSPYRLNVILPVGISFYTFQTLSYSIDLYKRKIKHSKNFISFFAFVSFFPQLVAGPIERASNLLHQFYSTRSFKYYEAVDGIKQVLWGFFKKIVIADSSAVFVNQIFESPGEFNGSTLLLGAIFFSFQIYGDFSGYSDMAIGIAKFFGFSLKQNFSYPYFSRDIAEFWRRWHISLSTWFRDYLYIPLGGSKGGRLKKIRNTLIIFVVSGFWHGANWTFIIWGTINALYFLPLLLTSRNRQNIDIAAGDNLIPSFKEIRSIIFTFILTTFAWIFFRAEDINHAINYISGVFSISIFEVPEFAGRSTALKTVIIIFIFIFIEWIGRNQSYAIKKIGSSWSRLPRWGFYFILFLFIIAFYGGKEEFIYFDF